MSVFTPHMYASAQSHFIPWGIAVCTVKLLQPLGELFAWPKRPEDLVIPFLLKARWDVQRSASTIYGAEWSKGRAHIVMSPYNQWKAGARTYHTGLGNFNFSLSEIYSPAIPTGSDVVRIDDIRIVGASIASARQKCYMTVDQTRPTLPWDLASLIPIVFHNRRPLRKSHTWKI